MSIRSIARRTAVAATGGALAASGLLAVAPAPHAAAAPVNAEAEAAAAWLAGQLDEDGLFDSGFDAVGSTVDFSLSLLETDPSSATLDTIAAGVEGVLATYIGTVDEPNAGKTAKAALLFQRLADDPANVDVAGIDLLERLESVVGPDGQLGEFEDVYGQSFAVTALEAAGSAEAAAATATLISFQCPGGGWGYDDFTSGDCVSAVDGTAYTLLALLPQQGESPVIDEAIDDAIAWLKGQQRADGGFGDWGVNNNGTTSEGNGTGLAAWALGEAGETAEAERAATWVADHQIAKPVGCATSPVAGEEGALAYDDLNIESAITNGITATDRGTWTFTGAQALAGLKYLPARPAQVATVNGPITYVHAGTSVTVDVTGIRPGQQACVTAFGTTRWIVGAESITATLPAGTANYEVVVNHADGTSTRTVKALDAATLKVKVADRVKAKKKAKIKVTGLAASETTTITFGKRTHRLTANAAGKAVVKLKAPKSKGKAKVKVTGEFADRKGKAKVRVV